MSESPRLLVFQHLEVEHPGVFRDFLAADGIPWDVIELDAGAAIPDLERYAGLWVMGGPMDVWQVSEHPWLALELAAIRRAVVELRMPFLGICLGHQLLAAALGGTVGPGRAEVGVMPVELTAAGRDSEVFAGLPQTLTTLQWHGAEVNVPPPGARILARSEACAVQALAVSGHAVSAQFHIEATADTVAEWGAIPAYAQALDVALGAGALPRFENEVARHLAQFNRDAYRFYANWMRVSGFPYPERSL
jgi:GMP synthase-like glutamine amidotransferase